MKMNTLGRTGIAVSELCLGTMTWGEQNTQADAFEQMDFAVEAGVNFFDTAEMYPTNPLRRETAGRTRPRLVAITAPAIRDALCRRAFGATHATDRRNPWRAPHGSDTGDAPLATVTGEAGIPMRPARPSGSPAGVRRSQPDAAGTTTPLRRHAQATTPIATKRAGVPSRPARPAQRPASMSRAARCVFFRRVPPGVAIGRHASFSPRHPALRAAALGSRGSERVPPGRTGPFSRRGAWATYRPCAGPFQTR